jgi:chromosome segregation ATPase
MATNMVEVNARDGFGEESLRTQRLAPAPERPPEPSTSGKAASGGEDDFALRPLVDKVAYAFASGLIVAMRELDAHIANQTQQVSDSVHQHLTALESSFKDALSEQRAVNAAVQEKCRELEAATVALGEVNDKQQGELEALRGDAASFGQSVTVRFGEAADSLRSLEERQTAQIAGLGEESRQVAAALQERISTAEATLQEADAHNATEIAAVRAEMKEISGAAAARVDALAKELMLHQEDLGALKASLAGFSSAVDSFAERLDRQAESLRSMFAAYSQRETQLEQLVDGLTRLRPYPPPPAPQF